MVDWSIDDKRTRGYHVGSIIKPRMLPTNKTLHLSRASHITQNSLNCMSLQVLCWAQSHWIGAQGGRSFRRSMIRTQEEISAAH